MLPDTGELAEVYILEKTPVPQHPPTLPIAVVPCQRHKRVPLMCCSAVNGCPANRCVFDP